MRRQSTALLLALTLFCLTACQTQSQQSQRHSTTYFDLFDTVTTLVSYGGTEEEFDQMADTIYDHLLYYHQQYDIYNEYPDIHNVYTLNTQAALAPVVVDQAVIDLLLLAKEAYQLSEGRVNIAFGAVLTLWHQYREAGLADPDGAELPPMEELEAAALHCNIEDIIIDEVASTVFFADPLLQLDVGSIAKGYAAQLVVEEMEVLGLDNFLLGVGGNLTAVGTRDGAEDLWPVGVEDPFSEESGYLTLLDISDQSLVTSGNYQRYYTVDGVDYHHIIDPDTLMPTQGVALVTILAEDGGMADILSTAVFSLPYDQGLALVESIQGVEAIWVDETGEMTYTEGFYALLQEEIT